MPARKSSAKRAGKRTKPKSPGKMIKRSLGLDVRVSDHVNMIVDPCNAPLKPTAYRGSDGIVSRFSVVSSLVSNTDNTFVYAFYPAYNGALLTSNTGGTVSTNWNTPGPGQSFLLNTASTQRAVAACLQVDYAGKEIDRQGTLYAGTIAADAIGASFSPATLASLLQKVVRTPDGTLEIKWAPTPAEETYWSTGAAAPDSGGDRQILLIIGFGFTSGLSFNLRTTLISEWRPKTGLGIQTPTVNTPDSIGGLEKVRTMLSRMGDWWVSGAGLAHQAMVTYRRARNATRMLSGGLATLAIT